MNKIELKSIKDSYLIESYTEKGLFVGFRQSDQLQVSAKKIKHNNKEYLNSYKVFSHIDHPSIAKTLDLVELNGDLYVVREFHNGTSLKIILETRSIYHKLSERFFIELTIELLNALQALHESGLLHLDLKPANIIVRHTENDFPKDWRPNNILLIDFEQSLIYPVSKSFRNRFTLVYSPPEQLLNRLHLLNPSSDISAVGIMLYEMIAGSAPYVDCNAEIIVNLQLTYPIKKRPSMREEFFEIIKNATNKVSFPKPPRMLDYNTIDELLIKGIKGRYQNTNEVVDALKNYLELTKEQEPSWWHNWLKRLGF